MSSGDLGLLAVTQTFSKIKNVSSNGGVMNSQRIKIIILKF